MKKRNKITYQIYNIIEFILRIEIKNNTLGLYASYILGKIFTRVIVSLCGETLVSCFICKANIFIIFRIATMPPDPEGLVTSKTIDDIIFLWYNKHIK